jgi:hypothetical protein
LLNTTTTETQPVSGHTYLLVNGCHIFTDTVLQLLHVADESRAVSLDETMETALATPKQVKAISCVQKECTK